MKSRDFKFIAFYIFISVIVGLLMFKLIAQSDILTTTIRLIAYVFISIEYNMLILFLSKFTFSNSMFFGKLCVIIVIITTIFIFGMSNVLFKKEIFTENVFVLYFISLASIQTPISLALLCLYWLDNNLNITNLDSKDDNVE